MNDLDLMEKLAGDIVLSDFGPRLVIPNWDTECVASFALGKGIRVKRSRSFDSKTGKRYDDGIHSKFFGTVWEDEDAYKARYTCECGHFIGAVHEGEICPECKTVCGYVDVDMEKKAWIILDRFKIINPGMYALIEKYIGKTLLNKMLSPEVEFDEDAHIIKSTAPRDKYNSIGLTGFVDNFLDILHWLRPKRENKEKYYWEIIKKFDCVFASCIPIYPSMLRPIFTSPTEYHYTDTEKAYNAAIGCANKLNRYTGPIDETNFESVNGLLYCIQEQVNLVDKYTFKMLDKKFGHIHDGIFGGRIDFSARDVIVPDPTLEANQISLSYAAVHELYKLELINLIQKISGCNENAALKIWWDGHMRFSNYVYNVMIYLLRETKHGLWCVINRNPSIDHGSGITVQIVKIPKSYDNMTMGVPIPVLRKMNADFDGDNLNIISLKTNRMKRVFRANLDPTRSMYISNVDGGIDHQNFLLKDQMIGLHQFCAI